MLVSSLLKFLAYPVRYLYPPVPADRAWEPRPVAPAPGPAPPGHHPGCRSCCRPPLPARRPAGAWRRARPWSAEGLTEWFFSTCARHGNAQPGATAFAEEVGEDEEEKEGEGEGEGEGEEGEEGE